MQSQIKPQQRIGDWFLTQSGIKFYPFDPRPEEISIFDIAHALSNICRFGGHSKTFYSVAQHSVYVSRLVPNSPFQALMHDAPEAYCGDVIRPIKYSHAILEAYKEIETRIWIATCKHFSLSPMESYDSIKRADNIMLMTERRDLMVESSHPWSLEKDFSPTVERIAPLPPNEAKQFFLEAFEPLWMEHEANLAL